jgi:signal transduction histidine kinase
VGNALKFTKQGQRPAGNDFAGRWQGRDFNVLFTVSDTGIGIPDDKLMDLFKPFVQVDGSYTRSFQGAGLGPGHSQAPRGPDGREDFHESTFGEGTTVHVLLPFKLPEGESIPAEQEIGTTAEASRNCASCWPRTSRPMPCPLRSCWKRPDIP